jgi:hypothetical protein
VAEVSDDRISSQPLDYAPAQQGKRQALAKLAFVLSTSGITLIIAAHFIFRGILPSPAPNLPVMTVTGTFLLVSIALGSVGLIAAELSFIRIRTIISFASLVAGIGYLGVFLWIWLTGGL